MTINGQVTHGGVYFKFSTENPKRELQPAYLPNFAA